MIENRLNNSHATHERPFTLKNAVDIGVKATAISFTLFVFGRMATTARSSNSKNFFQTIFHFGSRVPVCGSNELDGSNETRAIARSSLASGTRPSDVPLYDQPRDRLSKNARNMGRLPSQRRGRFLRLIFGE